MDYTPHTEEEIQAMLEALGLERLEDLYAHLPGKLLNPEIELPAPLDEDRALALVRELAAMNRPGPVFLGGGVRDHFIPAIVDELASRGEFLTAYTPYQAEASQGVLQATFEYQTMIAELTALDVANASLYDGASALAEGALLALRATRRMAVLVSQGVHPEYREVLKTYLDAVGARVEEVPLEAGRTPALEVGEEFGAVIVQSPNFLGAIEGYAPLAEAAHRAGALLIAVVDPLSLAVLKPPGEQGADIAVGEGQPLGNPMNFGGPHFGFIAVRERLLRQLPGRLVSMTEDQKGRRGFVLALSAREQHIRRAKAKSNITTNAQNAALRATIHLAALGPEGLREAALASAANARRLYQMLLEAPGVSPLTEPPFFAEFALLLPRPAHEVRRALFEAGFHGAYPTPEFGERAALFAATERADEATLFAFAQAFFKAVGG